MVLMKNSCCVKNYGLAKIKGEKGGDFRSLDEGVEIEKTSMFHAWLGF